MKTTNGTIYRYRWSKYGPSYVAAIAIAFALFGFGVRELLEGRPLSGLLVWILFVLPISLGFVGMHHVNPGVSVSDAGISAYAFRRQSRFIDWREVTKMKKIREWSLAIGRYKTRYAIQGSKRSHFILFDEQIVGIDELLSRLNEYAQGHGIEIVSLDSEAGGEVSRTKPADGQGELVAQLVSKRRGDRG